jgi:hypothetical protein
MELVNVTSRNNNLMEEFIEDLNTITLDKPIVYNSSVESSNTSSVASLNTGAPLKATLRPVATLKATLSPVATPDAPLRPDFMSPHPNNNYNKNNIKNNIKNNKRTYINAFEELTLEDDRYGQHIGTDFFIKNIGHNYTNSNDFDAYYQANRNLFNV